MAKRKTQLERAIETLEGKKAELTRAYESELAGLNRAIDALKSQPTRKPRLNKPREVARPA